MSSSLLSTIIAASDLNLPRLVQLCILDHGAHVHVIVHLKSGRPGGGSESSQWTRLDMRLDEIKAAARTINRTVRFHMHYDETRPSSTPCSADLLDRLSACSHSVTDAEAAHIGCCPICLVDVEAGDEIICLPCEGEHVSHKACIRPWLEQACTCPECRFELPTEASPDRIEQLVNNSIAALERLKVKPASPSRVPQRSAPSVSSAVEAPAARRSYLSAVRQAVWRRPR